jgi:hypothetical protein
VDFDRSGKHPPDHHARANLRFFRQDSKPQRRLEFRPPRSRVGRVRRKSTRQCGEHGNEDRRREPKVGVGTPER